MRAAKLQHATCAERAHTRQGARVLFLLVHSPRERARSQSGERRQDAAARTAARHGAAAAAAVARAAAAPQWRCRRRLGALQRAAAARVERPTVRVLGGRCTGGEQGPRATRPRAAGRARGGGGRQAVEEEGLPPGAGGRQRVGRHLVRGQGHAGWRGEHTRARRAAQERGAQARYDLRASTVCPLLRCGARVRPCGGGDIVRAPPSHRGRRSCSTRRSPGTR